MKAVRVHQWGTNDVVKIETVPMPRLQDNDVLIAVEAAGLNPIDWKVREGYFNTLLPNPFPFTLGWDVAGTVVAVNQEDCHFKEGDNVYGLVRFPQEGATFAQYVSAPADHLYYQPRHLTAVEAAGIPLVTLTAWQALFETADVKAGQRVLVAGAGGGVGQMAVQLAKWKKAQVIALASAKKEKFLRSLNVDEFFDYAQENVGNKIPPVDIVIDLVGGETTLQAVSAIKPGGKIVTLVNPLHEKLIDAAKEKNIYLLPMIVRPHAEHLKDITHLFNDGLLTITVQDVYPFNEVHQALVAVQQGHSQGKIILEMAEKTYS